MIFTYMFTFTHHMIRKYLTNHSSTRSWLLLVISFDLLDQYFSNNFLIKFPKFNVKMANPPTPLKKFVLPKSYY